MRMIDLIQKKRDGHELSKDDIQYMVDGYTSGVIPDYQMSAMLMAVFFQNMTVAERSHLTMAMAASGDQIDLHQIHGIKVDKHSAGGVGDTTTLCLAPLVASVGVPVAKMSGRGLGHTGGTIDKLASIPNFRTEVEKDVFIDLVNRNQIAVVGQSGNLTPADKKMYALRDVTATIDSIPLIASSIMSKKIASGADAIVLDVKTGTGAFMKNIEDARKLARAMIEIGREVGRQTTAIISDMNQPLGYAVGNALEVKEAIDVLKGRGPNDLIECCLTLGSHMVCLAKKAASREEARTLLEKAIMSGATIQKMKTFIASQGGDAAVVEDPSRLPTAKNVVEVKAKEKGFVASVAADEIGMVSTLLGAGRATKDSPIDLSVGIVIHKKIGDVVHRGNTLAEVHHNGLYNQEIERCIEQAFMVSESPVPPVKLIHEEIYN